VNSKRLENVLPNLNINNQVSVEESIVNESLSQSVINLTSLFGFVINNTLSSNELLLIHPGRLKTQTTQKVRLDLNS
jgi:hypothetical protein